MLSARKERVLKIIVDEYIRGGTPVPSESVARSLPDTVSAATVRNEMADLEEGGYITRPYSSAGGVPSNRGYRSFVESLDEDLAPARELQEAIQRRFRRSQPDVEEWTRTAVELLAQLVHSTAVASPPRAVESRWKHLELVYVQEFLVLLVMVLEKTRLKQQLVPLQQPFTQDELSLVSNRLNAYFGGLTHREMAARSVETSPFEEEVKEVVAGILRTEEEEEGLADPYVDGLRHTLQHPDLSQGSRGREFVEFLEDRSLLRSVLSEIPPGGVVRVVIGDENKVDILRPFSIVFSRYGIPEESSGVLGIVGPTRMEYANAISIVRYLSVLMSGLVREVHG